MAETLPRHRLRACNTATDSENRIHDDEVAGAFGFGGGLVPGVDVYAYLCQPAVGRWGGDLLARGRLTVRFGSPVYDGERIEIVSELDDDGRLTATVHRDGQPIAATLEARLDDGGSTPPEVAAAERPEPTDRQPASESSLAVGTVLGSLQFHCDRDDLAAYLTSIGDEHSPVSDLGLVHPGRLLRLANSVLSETVKLGPWIHVGSEIHNHAPVALDEEISVRGVVTGNYEHRGHRFVDIDAVLVGADGSIRTWIEHKAIYEPRPLRGPRI